MIFKKHYGSIVKHWKVIEIIINMGILEHVLWNIDGAELDQSYETISDWAVNSVTNFGGLIYYCDCEWLPCQKRPMVWTT